MRNNTYLGIDLGTSGVKVREVLKPDATLVEKYRTKYDISKKLYPALKDVYSDMNK